MFVWATIGVEVLLYFVPRVLYASSAQALETIRPPCCHKNWSLPGKFADSNSEGFSFPFSRCLQNSEWLFSDQHILKVHYPKLSVSEDCLYLNIYAPAHADTGSKLPVRRPALLRAPVGRFWAWAPGRVAGCLESDLGPHWVKGKCNHLTCQ